MFRRMTSLGLLSFALSAAACAAPDESTAESEDAIATSTQLVACSKPVGTDDGEWIVYVECVGASGEGRIVRRSVRGGGAATRAGSYKATDKVLAAGTTGKYVYWALRHADGSYDFNVATFRTTWDVVVTKIPLEGMREPLEGITITEAGDIAFLAYASGGQKLVVGKVGSTTPRLVEHVPYVSASAVSLWSTTSSRRMLLSQGGRTLRVLDPVPSTPTLSASVSPAAPVLTSLRDTFDGYGYLAKVGRSADGYSVARVEAKTGAVRVIAGPFKQIADVAKVAASHVVYSAQKLDGTWAIERASLGGTGVPRTLVTDPDLLWFRVSTDRSTLVFRGGPERGSKPNWLGVTPVDGAIAPAVAIPKEENLELQLDRTTPATNRFVLGVKDRATRAESIRLVDDRTGNTLGAFDKGVDYNYSFSVELSGDGQVLYAPRSCDSGGGELITQLWPSPTVLTGCRTNTDDELLPIPNSSAMMLSTRTGARSVTVFRP
ncbi:MAG: hypothetical protein KIT84_24005 [Labilithrix sp.]|nr:hypothetical protein [Labilithrix sp.]MCW5814114.1 hypothetical protein [Labilithrix sp.]